MLRDETRRGQLEQPRSRQLGIEGPVEVCEVDGLLDTGLLEASREEPVRASHQLVLHEQFEEFETVEIAAAGLLDACRECLQHPGETEMTKLSLELRVHRRSSRA